MLPANELANENGEQKDITCSSNETPTDVGEVDFALNFEYINFSGEPFDLWYIIALFGLSETRVERVYLLAESLGILKDETESLIIDVVLTERYGARINFGRLALTDTKMVAS